MRRHAKFSAFLDTECLEASRRDFPGWQCGAVFQHTTLHCCTPRQLFRSAILPLHPESCAKDISGTKSSKVPLTDQGFPPRHPRPVFNDCNVLSGHKRHKPTKTCAFCFPRRTHAIHSPFATVSSSFHTRPAAHPEPAPNPGRPKAPSATHPHFGEGWRWVSPGRQAAAQQVTGRCQAGVDLDGRGGVGVAKFWPASPGATGARPGERARTHAGRQAGRRGAPGG